MSEHRTPFEKHFQTAIQVLLVALVVWAGSQLVNIGKQYAVLEERLTSQGALLTEMRTEIKAWSSLYWRREEARRELDSIESRIDGLDDRVAELERIR